MDSLCAAIANVNWSEVDGACAAAVNWSDILKLSACSSPKRNSGVTSTCGQQWESRATSDQLASGTALADVKDDSIQ